MTTATASIVRLSIVVGALAVALVACGGDDDGAASTTTAATTSTAASTTTTTALSSPTTTLGGPLVCEPVILGSPFHTAMASCDQARQRGMEMARIYIPHGAGRGVGGRVHHRLPLHPGRLTGHGWRRRSRPRAATRHRRRLPRRPVDADLEPRLLSGDRSIDHGHLRDQGADRAPFAIPPRLIRRCLPPWRRSDLTTSAPGVPRQQHGRSTQHPPESATWRCTANGGT